MRRRLPATRHRRHIVIRQPMAPRHPVMVHRQPMATVHRPLVMVHHRTVTVMGPRQNMARLQVTEPRGTDPLTAPPLLLQDLHQATGRHSPGGFQRCQEHVAWLLKPKEFAWKNHSNQVGEDLHDLGCAALRSILAGVCRTDMFAWQMMMMMLLSALEFRLFKGQRRESSGRPQQHKPKHC